MTDHSMHPTTVLEQCCMYLRFCLCVFGVHTVSDLHRVYTQRCVILFGRIERGYLQLSGLGSSFGVATCYGPGGLGIESR
jgi:hypothetical protein